MFKREQEIKSHEKKEPGCTDFNPLAVTSALVQGARSAQTQQETLGPHQAGKCRRAGSFLQLTNALHKTPTG